MTRILDIFVSAMVSAVITLALAQYLYGVRLAQLETATENRPPMVVLDYLILAKTMPNGTTPEELNRQMVNLTMQASQYKEAGYIVLNSEAIIGSPESIIIKPDLSLPSIAPSTTTPEQSIRLLMGKPEMQN
jgi:hypothetical protein